MNVTTTYKNLGPEVKELRELPIDSFFQFPEEGTVYRVLGKHENERICLNLDDLQSFTQPGTTIVEPREVNAIRVEVELL